MCACKNYQVKCKRFPLGEEQGEVITPLYRQLTILQIKMQVARHLSSWPCTYLHPDSPRGSAVQGMHAVLQEKRFHFYTRRTLKACINCKKAAEVTSRAKYQEIALQKHNPQESAGTPQDRAKQR